MNIYKELRSWGDCGEAVQAYLDHGIKSHEEAWDVFVASDKHNLLVFLGPNSPMPREKIAKFLDITVERAIRRALAVYNVPAFVTWANKWLSGEDRTENMARTAEGLTKENNTLASLVARCAALSAAYASKWADQNTGSKLAAWDVVRAGDWAELAASTKIYEERLHQANWWRKQPNPFKPPVKTPNTCNAGLILDWDLQERPAPPTPPVEKHGVFKSFFTWLIKTIRGH